MKSTPQKQCRALLVSLRPWQWFKNGLLFAGVLFSGNLFNTSDLILVIKAFFVFSFGSGAIYILNDIIDRPHDQEHPQKKLRPIASGQLNVQLSASVAVVLFVATVIYSIFTFNVLFTITYISYLGLMLLYVFSFKHIVIVDLLSVAIGFVFRAVAGAVVIMVAISPWLVICTFLVSLLLLMGKRRHEIFTLRQGAKKHRAVLEHYSLRLIDQMFAVVTSSSIIAYSLYTFSEQTIKGLKTHYMPLTIPFVLYAIFRYLYLTHQRNLGGSPETLVFQDKAMFINIVLWVIISIMIIYFT